MFTEERRPPSPERRRQRSWPRDRLAAPLP